MPGERAGGAEDFDESLEGQVLVGVGAEVGLPDAGEEVGEAGVAGGVGAQHEGVDEEAHEVFDDGVGAAGDGVPIGMSVPAPSRCRRVARAAWSTMKRLVRVVRARSARAACRLAGTSKATRSPSWDWLGGRGRSVGSSSSSGRPASVVLQ